MRSLELIVVLLSGQTMLRKISQAFLPSWRRRADILPLYRLNKRQGKQLLKVLGADPALYEKVPIADLEEEKPGLADEVALGVTYEEIDDYLEGKQISQEAQATMKNGGTKANTKRHLPITVFDTFWR